MYKTTTSAPSGAGQGASVDFGIAAVSFIARNSEGLDSPGNSGRAPGMPNKLNPRHCDSVKRRYIVRTLIPPNGYRAVWSQAVGNNIEIETRQLDFIALVEVQLYRDGEWTYDDWEFVGIGLADGFFDVVTDCENCHGIVRQGATWEDCVSLLPTELQRRAVPASTRRSSG